jgi:hypothetical protein
MRSRSVILLQGKSLRYRPPPICRLLRSHSNVASAISSTRRAWSAAWWGARLVTSAAIFAYLGVVLRRRAAPAFPNPDFFLLGACGRCKSNGAVAARTMSSECSENLVDGHDVAELLNERFQ